MKKFFATLGCLLLLVSCNSKQRAPNTLIVGTIAGPETTLMEVAKDVAQKEDGLNIDIVTFNDYVLPNQALADGSIDANVFQHQPYLDAAIKARGFKLISVGKTFVYPMGLYSKKITNLKQLKPGSTVAIPNDPSNESRALLLLQKANLITLQSNADTTATIRDIKDNPNNLQFKEIDAAQLPRLLDEVDLAAVNTTYIMMAGLTPSKDALFLESKDSPYANIIVVRQDEKDNPLLTKLIAALHSKAVQEKATELFKGQAIVAW